jgi:hypothetical protein
MDQQAQEMKQLDADISHLAVRLGELPARRASVNHGFDVNRSLLAPVRNLPPETLGEVFTHCLIDPYKHISFQQVPLLPTGGVAGGGELRRARRICALTKPFLRSGIIVTQSFIS